MTDQIEILCDGDIPYVDESTRPRRSITRHVSDRTCNSSRRHSYSRECHKVSRSISMSTDSPISYGHRLSVARHGSVRSDGSFRSSRRSSSRRSRHSLRHSPSVRSTRSVRSSRRSSCAHQGLSRQLSNGARSQKSISSYQEPISIKEKNHRRIVVWVIVCTFVFILMCSVLAVVVTLTHRSQFQADNETLSYYTFSPDAKVLNLGKNGTKVLVKKS
ncbi:uncharacterized protein LOC108740301 isoform X1 [Agrilus planipennis]|uniref:Uncharacterized protein LOC108740301 isoform X1 n=1 Tax=Agrilus planipennis TaxID=224129 RepID=A0A1W4XB89_AGRPL|nr:uncharacterized protein LOC108740301 isoform X1 [Agrilus planipennis]